MRIEREHSAKDFYRAEKNMVKSPMIRRLDHRYMDIYEPNTESVLKSPEKLLTELEERYKDSLQGEMKNNMPILRFLYAMMLMSRIRHLLDIYTKEAFQVLKDTSISTDTGVSLDTTNEAKISFETDEHDVIRSIVMYTTGDIGYTIHGFFDNRRSEKREILFMTISFHTHLQHLEFPVELHDDLGPLFIWEEALFNVNDIKVIRRENTISLFGCRPLQLIINTMIEKSENASLQKNTMKYIDVSDDRDSLTNDLISVDKDENIRKHKIRLPCCNIGNQYRVLPHMVSVASYDCFNKPLVHSMGNNIFYFVNDTLVQHSFKVSFICENDTIREKVKITTTL